MAVRNASKTSGATFSTITSVELANLFVALCLFRACNYHCQPYGLVLADAHAIWAERDLPDFGGFVTGGRKNHAQSISCTADSERCRDRRMILDIVSKDIRKKLSAMCTLTKGLMLRMSKPSVLQTFSWELLESEVKETAPSFYAISISLHSRSLINVSGVM